MMMIIDDGGVMMMIASQQVKKIDSDHPIGWAFWLQWLHLCANLCFSFYSWNIAMFHNSYYLEFVFLTISTDLFLWIKMPVVGLHPWQCKIITQIQGIFQKTSALCIILKYYNFVLILWCRSHKIMCFSDMLVWYFLPS